MGWIGQFTLSTERQCPHYVIVCSAQLALCSLAVEAWAGSALSRFRSRALIVQKMRHLAVKLCGWPVFLFTKTNLEKKNTEKNTNLETCQGVCRKIIMFKTKWHDISNKTISLFHIGAISAWLPVWYLLLQSHLTVCSYVLHGSARGVSSVHHSRDAENLNCIHSQKNHTLNPQGPKSVVKDYYYPLSYRQWLLISKVVVFVENQLSKLWHGHLKEKKNLKLFIHHCNISEQTRDILGFHYVKSNIYLFLYNIKIGLNNLGAPHKPIPLDKKLTWVFHQVHPHWVSTVNLQPWHKVTQWLTAKVLRHSEVNEGISHETYSVQCSFC